MIFDRLLETANTAPAASGMRYRDEFVSYATLASRAERLARGLADRGIGKGSVVALLITNSPDLALAAHALFAIGAIAMPLSPGATRAELLGLAKKTGLDAVVSMPSNRASAEALVADMGSTAALYDTSQFADLEQSGSPLPAIDGDTNALYLFSSGSTGLPKIVPHTHAELLADGARTTGAWGLRPDDVMADILPGNFAMGFLMGAIDVMTAGATTLYWNDPLPLALARRRFLDAANAHRVSIFGAVPAMFELLAADTSDTPLPLRLAFCGGAGMKRSARDIVRARFGFTVRQSYGSTEAAMVSINAAPDPEPVWDSVGPPAPGVDASILPVETGFGPDTGELLLRSPSVMKGYIGEPAANAEAFIEDGWFRTGDLASIDSDGNITIRGRLKLLIEVSGFKIDPIEVEEVLLAHPGIAEIAVAGIPDSRSGNRLRAYVVRNEGTTADDILRLARERLSSHKVPTEISFIDALPRTATGKLQRTRLTELG